MAEVFPDSKSFVDMHMKMDPEEILKDFDVFMDEHKGEPSKDDVKNFVTDHFDSGNELSEWTPNDYNPEPEFLKDINDTDMHKFAKDLVGVWPKLTRIMKPEVREHPERYSILPVTEGFIIPGGRFKETYYWDTYWIIKGLLISGMHETARGMLDNFVTLIKEYGFIPNGFRKYYLKRSQPPLFTPMVKSYIDATEDVAWLKDNIQYLDAELQYWIDNKMVSVKKNKMTLKMFNYKPESLGPRPESYREDYLTVDHFPESEKQRVYTDLKGGAESGWDYTTRWIFDAEGTPNSNLSDIHTSRSIPVDLNSFLYRAFSDLSKMYLKTHQLGRSKKWLERAIKLKTAISLVFWNSEDGIWYDFDNVLGTQRKYFWPSNLAPLWTGAFNTLNKNIGDKVVDYLEKNKVFQYCGGTPASLIRSGEQWDFPNAWPPLQAIMVQGLQKSGSEKAKKKAEELATAWLHANIVGFTETGEMFEKYDAEVPGQYGGGGEYTVQSGFGWTNGVALEFIKEYYTH